MNGWQPSPHWSPGWDPTNPELLPRGTRVRVRHTNGIKARVVAWHGPLGPGGVQTYRIRFGPKGARQYAEVLRDQLDVLPPKAGPVASPSADPPSPDPDPQPA